MNTFDRLALLLIGVLAGSALTVIVFGLSHFGGDPVGSRNLFVVATTIAFFAMAGALFWVGAVKRRR
jgi:hypothetical protein